MKHFGIEQLFPVPGAPDDSTSSHGDRGARSDGGHGAVDDGSGALTSVSDDRTRGGGKVGRRSGHGSADVGGDGTNVDGGIENNRGNDGRR